MSQGNEEYMMIGTNIRAITFWGLWPYMSTKYPFLNKIHKIYGKFNLLVFLTFYSSMTVQVFYIWKDLLQLMFNLSVLLLYIVVGVKISLFFTDSKRCSDLMDRTKAFQNKIMNGSNEKNKKILMRHVKVSRFISKGFRTMVYSTCFLLIFPGILSMLSINVKQDEHGNVIKDLPFSCWLPFDQQKYHITAVIVQVLLCIPGTAYVAVWDTWAISLIVNAICQVKVLQNSLLSLGSSNTKTVYESAVECVQLHQQIIKYVTDLDALIKNVLLFDFGVYAILLCSIGFRAIFDPAPEISTMVPSVTYLGAVLVQLYMFYYTGHQLMFQSVEIASAAWGSDWYKYDKPVVKLLILLMMRAQRPLKISVGRFYDMNLESFMVIIRAWYSYLTLLNQMKEDILKS